MDSFEFPKTKYLTLGQVFNATQSSIVPGTTSQREFAVPRLAVNPDDGFASGFNRTRALTAALATKL